MIRSFPPHPNPLPPGERVGHSSPPQSWGGFWHILINYKEALMNQHSALKTPHSALEKMNIQMIISGVGGQGVLLVTRIFAAFALQEGYPLIGSEDHGMSQRGGSVMTHLKIGNFDSPLVKKGGADILLSLEKNEAYKTLHYLKH